MSELETPNTLADKVTLEPKQNEKSEPKFTTSSSQFAAHKIWDENVKKNKILNNLKSIDYNIPQIYTYFIEI
jgi:hypothetical protein